MYKKVCVRILWISVAAILIIGCSGFGPEESPTQEIESIEDFTPVVSATGKVVPENWVILNMSTSGIVSEVMVQEDDHITRGETLVVLEGKENLQAVISAAEFEMTSAQYSLDTLFKNSDLLATQSYHEMLVARQDVKDAQQYLVNLGAPSAQGDIDQARANLAIAKINLDKAQDDFKPYEKKPENNIKRARYLSKLADAEKVHEGAVRRLNNLLGSASELDIEEAEADLELAEMRLDNSEKDYELYQEGPDPDEVRLAQERISNANVQLTAATAALDDLSLMASFSGTIVDVYVQKGEFIAPGQRVLLLAALDHLFVETTDLNEIDMAQVELGDNVIITFDALPDVTVMGTVTRIALRPDEGAGVNYTAEIELDEIPQRLRWGMTAFVDIEIE